MAQVIDGFAQVRNVIDADDIRAARTEHRLDHHRKAQAGHGLDRIRGLRDQRMAGGRQSVLCAELAEQVLVARQPCHLVGDADQAQPIPDAGAEQDIVFPEGNHPIGTQFRVAIEKVPHGPQRLRVVVGIRDDPVRGVGRSPVFCRVQDDQVAAEVLQALQREPFLAVAGVDHQQMLAPDAGAGGLAGHSVTPVCRLRHRPVICGNTPRVRSPRNPGRGARQDCRGRRCTHRRRIRDSPVRGPSDRPLRKGPVPRPGRDVSGARICLRETAPGDARSR